MTHVPFRNIWPRNALFVPFDRLHRNPSWIFQRRRRPHCHLNTPGYSWAVRRNSGGWVVNDRPL